MSQTTTGLRSLLSAPWAYELLQTLLGTQPLRRTFVQDYVRPFAGARILDLGCGPGTLVGLLPRSISYLGIDLSEDYIGSARSHYGERGEFRCMDVASLRDEGRKFDVVFSFGMLHHIDDERARHVFSVVRDLLEPGGRYVTYDPAYLAGQHVIARKIADWDRGEAVRTPDGYLALARSAFAEVRQDVRHDLWFLPLTGVLMECVA